MKAMHFPVMAAFFLFAAASFGQEVPVKQWELDTGVSNFSPAIGGDGTLYLTTDGKVIAVTPGGKLKWDFDPGVHVGMPVTVGLDGTLFFAGSNSNLWALDSNGNLKWETTTSAAVAHIAIGPNGPLNGALYCVTYQGVILALSTVYSGRELWQFDSENSVYTMPAISRDGTIFVGSTKKILAIDNKGRELWRFSVESPYYEGFQSPALGPDGTVYVPGTSAIYAFTPNGQKKWAFQITDKPSSAAESVAIGPDGTIYAGFGCEKNGSYSAVAYALRPEDGGVKWRFESADARGLRPPTVAADGTVYLGCEANALYALKPDGTLKWRFVSEPSLGIPGGMPSPALGPDGTVYAPSRNGKLYALAGSSPLADSSWPMLGGNLRRSCVQRYTGPIPCFDSIRYSSDKGFQILFIMSPGQSFKIDASSDMANWIAFTNVASAHGEAAFVDPASSSPEKRFYRANSK